MTSTLGVSTFVYFPYCFFNLLNPILGMIGGFVGFNVQRLAPEDQPAEASLRPVPVVDQRK
jgi:NhaC family Na+:H+ antiporter